MRDFIRSITPTFLLQAFRAMKKQKVRKSLEKAKIKGDILTKDQILNQLKAIGIKQGDSLMVHTAMSKIGYLENGPATLVEALQEAVGKNGNLLMPSSPVSELQLDYIKTHKSFDVQNTPSAMGSVSEYFRKQSNVIRSAHPTEPVCAWGEKAEWFTKDHFGQITPYNLQSPWYRLMEEKGKILYIGVTLINSGTHLHVLEDLTDFKYPIYYPETFAVNVTNKEGVTLQMQTKVHNPAFSKRRKCDELIPVFKKDKVLKEVKLGHAKTLLLDAEKMLLSMVNNYQNKGITMYTPHGEKIEDYE